MTLLDDVTGAVFASSKMPPVDLPDSFKIDTTLHLGDDNWSVIHAEPQTKAEFTKSGKLTLRLRKVELMDPRAIRFSQLDITERFDDNQSLAADDWIATTPLNATIEDPESAGLPSCDADLEELYRVASNLSELRESIPIPNDGVYCPICHIANVDPWKTADAVSPMRTRIIEVWSGPNAGRTCQLDPQSLVAQSVCALIGSPSFIAGKLP